MKRRTAVKAAVAAAILVLGAEAALQVGGVLAGRRARAGLDRPGAAVALCLGDSHTYGAGVEAEEAYPARLQALLAARGLKANVVNLGAPGMNTAEIRRELPELLERYRPVAVIVLAGVNDGWNRKDAAWADGEDGRSVPLLTRAWDLLGSRLKLVKAATLIVHRLDWTRPAEERSKDRLGAAVLHDQREGAEDPQVSYDRARRNLIAIIAESRASGAVPILMTYVTDPNFDFETPNLLLRRTAAEMNAGLADNDLALKPLLYPNDRFDQTARDRLFLPDMHPKPPAYQLIAQNVLATLETAGVIAAIEKQ